MPRSVLIPVDGSENSQRAFDFYLSDIRQPGDLILLSQIQDTPNVSIFKMHQSLQVLTDDWISQIQEVVDRSKKVITHYERLCEQANMTIKVIREI